MLNYMTAIGFENQTNSIVNYFFNCVIVYSKKAKDNWILHVCILKNQHSVLLNLILKQLIYQKILCQLISNF